MMRVFKFVSATILSIVLAGPMAATTGFAQSSFRAVAEVGDKIVTGYEVDQRIRFLELQNTQGDLAKQAIEDLIDERLRMIAIEKAGIRVSNAELQAAIDEIAARTDRTGQEFLADLANQGVDPSQFVATTQTSLAWRRYIQTRFGALASATDSEVDRELGLAGGRGLVEVRFAEIFLPVNTPNNIAITQDLAPQIRRLTNFAEFSDAARRFSVGGTRADGGVVEGWVPITNIPAEIRAALTKMSPGQVTAPVDFEGAIGLFQLRGIREAKAQARTTAIDFMTYRVPQRSGRSASQQAEVVMNQIDSCNDLYGIAKNDPEEFLIRQTQAPAAIERLVASQLDRLDPGESASVTGNDGTVRVVTLCARVAGSSTAPEDADKEAIRLEISNRKLGSLAQALLQELRGETVIRRK